ncbi:hypothetical protein [Staphylococcus caprae]|uniref:hypothetical protein n=1 Tax=Staphylococcus caprae TaxID=29380 RepID=UPI000CD09DD8|nr:hypothetical protein [Staphylococcus caprae]MDI9230611.1 hypothetical protein [Staphylococcus caprae]POA02570.1 hypothetical protein CD155_10940 [Staphylococcus caprae]SUL94484.1 Uncharacterised protein [Staphylococcus caprae]
MRNFHSKLSIKDILLIIICILIAVACFLITFDIVELPIKHANTVATIFTIIVFISLIRTNNKKRKRDGS